MMKPVHVHDRPAVDRLVGSRLPAGIRFDAAGMSVALGVVSALIAAGAVSVARQAGCRVCEEPMAGSKNAGFAFTRVST